MVMKNKILVSLIVIVMAVSVVGSICSLATEGGGTLQLTETNNNNTANTANTESNNTSGNTSVNVGAEVGATNTNTANKTSNNTVKNTNSSRYNNTNSASSLPYAGSNTSIIFIVIALIVSAVYAYKKVSEYNA